MIKVKDHPDLVRDPYSNAIINTNSDVNMIVRRRKQRASRLGREILALREELAELKALITTNK